VDLGFQESDLDELAVTIETIAGSAVPLCLRIGKLIDDCLGRGTCSPAVKKELLGLLAHIRLSTVLTDCLRQSVTVGELAEHTNIYLQRHEPISLIAQERELATESDI
jgi:hypothetical protein